MRVIRFSLGTCYFMTPINEMQEIIQDFEIYPLPLTKPWLSGICNVRNIVFPVTDLWYFMTLKNQNSSDSKRKKGNILLFSQGEWQFGIKISEIQGILDLDLSRVNEQLDYSYELSRIAPCLTGIYVYDNKNYYIFHPHQLLELPEFMNSSYVQ